MRCLKMKRRSWKGSIWPANRGVEVQRGRREREMKIDEEGGGDDDLTIEFLLSRLERRSPAYANSPIKKFQRWLSRRSSTPTIWKGPTFPLNCWDEKGSTWHAFDWMVYAFSHLLSLSEKENNNGPSGEVQTPLERGRRRGMRRGVVWLLKIRPSSYWISTNI